jgi:hypothetical protein
VKSGGETREGRREKTPMIARFSSPMLRFNENPGDFRATQIGSRGFRAARIKAQISRHAIESAGTP